MATGSRLLVGAIDFGTTYSGWAFSFKHDYKLDPTKAVIKNWLSRSGTLVTEKTPTCLLVKPDGKTFQAFGYDAENEYRDLIDKNQHKEYYYFRRFKMVLFKKLGKGLSRNMTIDDELGKPLAAIDVFAMSIKYLTDDLLENAEKGLTGIIAQSDIQWVLTVPAIWSDVAKQFMREAADKAGIPKERFTIALEPEAASIYCRHLSFHTTEGSSGNTISKLPPGSKYVIIDAGGGTIDVTVHETGRGNTLREVRAADGGDWGGTMVDKAFENLLIGLVSEEVYEQFKVEETEDWLDMFREFESKKRETVGTTKARIGMRFPVSLTDMYTTKKQIVLKETIASSIYAESIELIRDKIKFSEDLFTGLFQESVQKTRDHVKLLMKDERMKDVKVVLMVGGYSESKMLQHAMEKTLPEAEVVIPLGASSTVLRGALIFGHNPQIITERVLNYTYGIAISDPFVEGKHPESKRSPSDDGDRCSGIFMKIAEMGQTVKQGESKKVVTAKTIYKYQTGIRCRIVASVKKDPKYVDEVGCTMTGEGNLHFKQPSAETAREVNVSMVFGGTELILNMEDVKTGDIKIATLDFLG